MRTVLATLLVYCLMGSVSPLLAEEPAPEESRQRQVVDPFGRVPIGRLGHPLGELLLLEGQRIDGPKTGIHTLRIEKINGVVLEKPKFIWIENLPLPANMPCAIYGYETMQIIGQAPAYEQLAKLKNRPAPTHPQAGWQIHCTFLAIEVEAPKTLEIPHKKIAKPAPSP